MTTDLLIDTDAQQQQQHPSHRAVEATKSFNSTSPPTQAITGGVGRPLAREDHVRGSAESLVTKASFYYYFLLMMIVTVL